ncbi:MULTISPECIES: DUF6153 family protein [unclassified Streptomyces]|uniref:DUF6153 family protein n=1 Tax=unclassified Streptomyces TaxID=2593676 RepID=UPI00236734A4|nr:MULTISPECIES: DUF6153 family protein [unclassified Streptomyces]MDF3142494.1 DUF6153 family protein [Streptomyces sp. T21Q-yed]WDF43917.1 DUF6153 family protein [Streptomyces sp. T12]
MLLVLGLLAGLLGMHALSPGGVVAVGAHHFPFASAHAGMAMGSDEYVCHGDSGNGHAEHADATCASGAVGTGPVLPAPLSDAVGTLSPADSVRGVFATAPDGGRAPPTLAELQLLRI